MTNPTACLLVIGNEVLSGRTQDLNIKFIATGLGGIGIPLREVRVIPDVHDTIVAVVNECRARFDHVFTTGGIGPTHDDITSECVAAAFGVPWEPHPEAWARMARHYEPGQFNAARQRMAPMPRRAASTSRSAAISRMRVLTGVRPTRSRSSCANVSAMLESAYSAARLIRSSAISAVPLMPPAPAWRSR